MNLIKAITINQLSILPFKDIYSGAN